MLVILPIAFVTSIPHRNGAAPFGTTLPRHNRWLRQSKQMNLPSLGLRFDTNVAVHGRHMLGGARHVDRLVGRFLAFRGAG